MNSAILAVSWFLAKTLNAGIVILAVVEAVLMIMAYNKMILLKKRIDALNGETPGKQVLRSKKAGIVETEYTVKVKKDWKEFDNFCDDYQNDSMLFSSVSLIIQIFPLRAFHSHCLQRCLAFSLRSSSRSWISFSAPDT